MKKCRQCGRENADQMQFCMECGTPLADAPMVFNLNNSSSPNSYPGVGGGSASNFGLNSQTQGFGDNQSNFMPNYITPPAKSKSKLGLILGGAAALMVLLGIAGAAIIAYNLNPDDDQIVANTTAMPTVSPNTGNGNMANGKTPLPRPSAALKSEPTPSSSDSTNPQPAFTPPTEPTKTGVFTVNANEGWQLSDIDVVASEQFTTSVAGAIDLAGIKATASPSGVADAKTKSRRIYDQFPTGALLMRTRYADGKTSNTIAVTAGGASGSWENFPNEIGKLEFCVNDNAPENNAGQFIVTARLTSVPKTKK